MNENELLAKRFEKHRGHLRAVAYRMLGLLVRPALVNGVAGAVSTRDGEPFSVVGFTVRGGKIVAIEILADPARLARLDLTVPDD